MKEGENIVRELEELSDPKTAAKSQVFFQTGKGEYGEGDRFRGVRVPQLRKLAQKYRDAPTPDAKKLLQSAFHEDRLLALFLLVLQYKKGDAQTRKRIYQLYIDNIDRVNNWDLVDSSAEHIVGHFLKNKDKRVLHELAASDTLWERRIAVMATFNYIKQGEFGETLKIVEALLNDKEDLIHKAAGWMLREIGKRDLVAEDKFLKTHGWKMPRVMLRYTIERFPEKKRLAYLKKDKRRRSKANSAPLAEKDVDARSFPGFPRKALSFFQELSLNNNRQWFKEHEKDRRDFILAPAMDFIAAIGEKLKTISPEIIADPRVNGSGSLMRIHRDLRFSKNKVPYHTHMRFIFWRGPGKKNDNPAFYFGADIEGLRAGAGQYAFSKDALKKYGKAVVDSRRGAELENTLRSISESENKYEIKGERYKRAPKGYDNNHERIELLRYKGLSVWTPLISWDIVCSADLIDVCFNHFKNLAPLYKWLSETV